MAYKFQRNLAIMSGSLIQEGSIEGTSLDAGAGGISNAGAIAGATSIDGSGDLTMGTITMSGFAVDADGDIAAKSLAVDNSSTIGCDADADLMTLAAQSIVIAPDAALTYGGTAITSTGAELNLVDGSSAGTVVNSKAVIYSAAGIVQGTDFKGPDGFDIGNATVADFMKFDAAKITIKDGALDFDIASHDGSNGLKLGGTLVVASATELDYTNVAAIGSAEGSKALVLDANKSISGIKQLDATGLSGSLEFSLDVAANGGLGMTPYNNAADVADLKIDAAYFSAEAVAVGADSFMFFDADGSVKKESLADYATAIAGSGLAASSGVLSVDLNEATAGVVNVAADSFTFIDADGNATKKDSYADYATAAAGDGLKAVSGAFALDLNELTAGALASGDSLAFVDSDDANATKKETVDDLATLFAGNGLSAGSAVMALDLNELSAAAVDVANDSLAIVDADDSNGSKKESIADLATAMAGAGLTATNGVFSVQGNSVAPLADGGTAAEGYNYIAADATAAVTVSLPAAPSVGDVVTIKAKGLSGNGAIVINRQGSHTIDGETQVTIESTYGAISFVYVVANDWRII